MTEKIRILWLTPNKPADISVGRQRIADHLEKRGVEVVLRGTTLRTIIQSFSERGKYDVIIGTTRAGAIAGTVLKIFGRIPLVVDHIDPIRQFKKTHSRWLAGLVQLLECLSFSISDHTLYVYEEEEKRVNRYATKTTQTNLGVEYDRFANPDSTIVHEALERVESACLEDNVAIYVGGLEPIYNITALMGAISSMDDWSLLILGDGSMADHVRTVAGERDEITYMGTVPHEMVPGYIHASDVGISLVDDSNTLKVLEYGAARLPVVQITGEARNRYGDFLYYCDDTPESISEAIEIANDSTENGDFQTYVSRFDWKEIATDYYQALKSVI